MYVTILRVYQERKLTWLKCMYAGDSCVCTSQGSTWRLCTPLEQLSRESYIYIRLPSQHTRDSQCCEKLSLKNTVSETPNQDLLADQTVSMRPVIGCSPDSSDHTCQSDHFVISAVNWHNILECSGARLISDVIDFEQQDEGGLMVAHGICEELDELKHTYMGLPDFLTKVHSGGCPATDRMYINFPK